MPIQKTNTRQNILGAAKRIFARKGFDGTSMAEIASAVGIKKASLYYFFRDKEEIFGAVMENSWTELADELRTRPTLINNDINQKEFANYLTRVIKTNLENGLSVLKLNSADWRNGAHKQVDYMRKRLREVLKRRKVKDPDLFEAMVVSSIQGFVIQSQIGNMSLSPQKFGKFLTNLIYRK